MASEVVLENEQQFWDELQQIVSTPCDSEDLIDNVLRAYLGLTVRYKDDYLNSELDISRASFKLFSSSLFAAHADYIRRQLLYGLLQEDDSKILHLISSFLLFDGRHNEATFHAMNEEGSFPRLLELLQNKESHDDGIGGGAGLHRLLMNLLYEMSRIQRLKIGDLVLVDDDFVKGLFGIVENLSYDANDPYHYTVIRVLLVLNEQFMISAHDPVDERSPSNFLTNKIMKVLSMHGDLYKTFGENIILLINREGCTHLLPGLDATLTGIAETSLQLLTLKLLYLIFTTPPTYEYFYTNDLHVLVDILIRNLLDLPEEAAALRHTYLRVLYPLLAHTQLRQPPHYKRDELKRMLNILIRGQLSEPETDYEKIHHFEDVDETTKRLVMRCATVEWLREVEPEPELEPEIEKTASPVSMEPLEASQTSSSGSDRETASPTPGSFDSHRQRKPSAIQRLGMHLEPASSSSLSVREVASQHEKPGVITPSRTELPPGTEYIHLNKSKPKIKPEPPKTRRWRGRRTNPAEEDAEASVDKIPEESEHRPSPLLQSTPARPLTPTTITAAARRNSANSSLAPPSVPAHARRSASNPPPAVPPPRRSATHPFAQAQNNPSDSNNNSNNNSPQQQYGKYGLKPEPPKTRRWRAHSQSQAQGQSQGQNQEPHVLTDPFGEAPVKPLDTGAGASAGAGTDVDTGAGKDSTVSVEEAVQNVSLQ